MDRPPLPEIALAGDERTLLTQFLDFYRAALLDRAWGLDADQLRQNHGPTRLTLAALLGHMALVERNWFASRLDGEAMGEPWDSLDWDNDADAEMTMAEATPVAELTALFEDACEDSRRRIDAADSLDQLSSETSREGVHWNLRWMLIHMIEEYARHVGHADLIRESIDGDTAS